MNCDAHDNAVKSLGDNLPDVETLETGHPAKTLHAENIALENFLDTFNLDDAEDTCEKFPRLNAIHAHYGKKEFLFMPILSQRGFPHPATFMWQVDDEIKKSVRTLAKNLSPENFAARKDKISETLQNLRDMIDREENVFIPMALKLFTDADWLAVYRDSLEMAPAFIDEIPRWQSAQIPAAAQTFALEGKIFDRPRISLGNEIFACHPPQVQPVIRKLLEDFKAKKRDRMEVWRPIKGKPVSVQYFAVYDAAGEYIGAVEIVQEHSAALQKFAKG